MSLIEIAVVLAAEAFLGFAILAIYEARQRGRIWAIELNTNSGKANVRRVKPDHESYTIRPKKGTEVVVKLEDAWSYSTKKGPLFIVDSDTGFIQRLNSTEGTFEGLDGKTWAAYLKSDVIQMIASASGGNLAQLLKYALIGIGLLGVLMIGGMLALGKYMGGGGG